CCRRTRFPTGSESTSSALWANAIRRCGPSAMSSSGYGSAPSGQQLRDQVVEGLARLVQGKADFVAVTSPAAAHPAAGYLYRYLVKNVPVVGHVQAKRVAGPFVQRLADEQPQAADRQVRDMPKGPFAAGLGHFDSPQIAGRQAAVLAHIRTSG